MPFKKPHHTTDPHYIFQQESGSYLIKPKGLNIIWGNDDRYWNVQEDVAELIQVSWLEVSGAVPVIKGKKYKVRFHVRVKADGFGWNNIQVLVMAKVGRRGNYEFKPTTLKSDNNEVIIPSQNDLEINVEPDASDNLLHFGLYEVWSGKWKGGLEILNAEVIPV
ncbi:PREDICTED: protein PHLOEM PROTEIN 2-LIKE A9-like isoform X2 [Lupinus angustifolius]|uniref:protein PHLOEM PROTEIN 2-LIKE A9-like isoform X2 n=1 Tax=Lupinus angustifolius TaxID=3871 RepID=UPI00092F03CB|nr:PREDICTED: protein PHLOEM PROTEIN 2-LIKE A9-like isoform X2 [Lupinus angustifolius]